MSFQLKDPNMDIEPNGTSAGICNSVEIMDTYLPPWVISGICDVMRSKGGDFQARYPNSSLLLKLERLSTATPLCFFKKET